jgi:hypothetical protein
VVNQGVPYFTLFAFTNKMTNSMVWVITLNEEEVDHMEGHKS